MSKDLAKNIGELNGSVKSYVQAKIDLAKLTLLEKVSRSISFLFNMIVVTLLFSMVIGFAAAAFAVWYGQNYHNYFEGVLIAGGFLIVVAVGFLLFRKKLVTNSVISNFSEILFEDDEQEKES